MQNKEVESVVCPFCRESTVEQAFLESENFYAVYNIAPIIRGHSLVISRVHRESLLDLTDNELAEFTSFARKVTELLLDAFKGEGFDWSVQEGPFSGQSVPHLHLHIVIRKQKDMEGESEWYLKVKENELQLLDTSKRIRLSAEEHLFYSDYLRNEARNFTMKGSEEKEGNA